MRLFFRLFLTTSIFLTLEASPADDAIAKMKAEFTSTKLQNQQSFKNYKKSLEKEYSNYKAQLKEYWQDPKLSSKKKWVSYSKDKKSRSNVDFENNKLVVEVIAHNKKEAIKRLQKQLAYAVGKNTKEVMQSDPLQKRIAQLSKKEEKVKIVADAKPILATALFDKKPTKKDIKIYTNRVIQENKITDKKAVDGIQNVYKITIPLPSDTRLKRSLVYKKSVFKNANRFKIAPELIFAIMQTESDFNPFAKSNIPAFGLMQIVPRSAGKDVYKFLYHKKGMPTATYLYNGENNIEMGSTYLYILYYRYLKNIKNTQSRLYCTIAAYNTGAGNIAWSYTRHYNMTNAVPLINAMTPDEVYEHLMGNLRYDEPKYYLKNVKKRMSAYKRAYKL